MKIGIFGGAFNPVHKGHIQLAENYLKKLSLDKLIFVPTSVPPHKTAQNLVSQKARFDMLDIAVKDNPCFEISDIEFNRQGKSYTYDTLVELEKLYPQAKFYLIIGADQFLTFDKWYKWQEILEKVTLCTCAREDEEEKKKILDFSKNLFGTDNDKFFLLDVPVLKLSSSEVRDKIGKGEDVSNLLPKGVYDYILKENLYGIRGDKVYDIEFLTSVIRNRLSDYRFHHSVCVAQCAKKLAKRYGADEEKAEVAGILHDAMKEASPQEQLEIIEKAGMEISDFEKSQFKFYHQISGCAFAKHSLNITDEEILNAIRYHTTGRDNMSLMEQIVYLADFISDDRDYDDIDNIRKEAEKGKEQGMLYATKYTIKSIVKKENLLHPDTVDAYNWLLKTFFNKEKGN